MNKPGWMQKRLRTIGNQVLVSVSQHLISDFYRTVGPSAMAFIGCYEGKMEHSFIMPELTFRWSMSAEPNIWRDQKTYILLENRRLGWTGTLMDIHDPDLVMPVLLGNFIEVDPDYFDLKTVDGWTYDPSSNTYYVCTM